MLSKKESPKKTEEKKSSFKFLKFIVTHVIPLFTVATLSALGVYLLATNKPEVLGINTSQKSDGQTEELLAEVKKLITSLQTPSPTPEVTPTPVGDLTTQDFNFALYNGTNVVGITKKVEEKLGELYPTSNVSSKAVAQSIDYTQTVLIDLSGTRPEVAKKIAQELKIAVGVLPPGEKDPDDADFLIIVGSDMVSPSTPTP